MIRKIKEYIIRVPVVRLANGLLANLDLLVQQGSFIRKRANKDLFLWDAREFISVNDISGDYYEFGLAKCRTFMKAMKILSPYVQHYHGFDSFKGLPDFEEGDEHPGWLPGAMNRGGDAKYFEDYMIRQRFDKSLFTLTEGFFEETLPNYTPSRKASVLFIDCDIVSSLKTVLEFIPRVLQDGTLVYFDDLFTYRANPRTGQQKTFTDFCSMQTDYEFHEFARYPPFAKAFVASRKAQA